jgi:hypothetical protein
MINCVRDGAGAPLFKSAPAAIQKSTSQVLSHVAGQLINLGTGVFFVCYGLKEMVLDSHPKWFRITPGENSPLVIKKIGQAVDWMLVMIRNQPTNMLDKIRYMSHGLLMVGTGVAGSVSALHRLGAFNVGAALRIFDFAACGFFIIGNLIYLEYSIEKFVEAVRHLKDRNGDKKNEILRLVAAAIGIISNISYIVASIATLATAPYLLPLIFGLLGMLAGSLRILLESIIAWKTQPKANII